MSRRSGSETLPVSTRTPVETRLQVSVRSPVPASMTTMPTRMSDHGPRPGLDQDCEADSMARAEPGAARGPREPASYCAVRTGGPDDALYVSNKLATRRRRRRRRCGKLPASGADFQPTAQSEVASALDDGAALTVIVLIDKLSSLKPPSLCQSRRPSNFATGIPTAAAQLGSKPP
jgi:hypothetical protein